MGEVGAREGIYLPLHNSNQRGTMTEDERGRSIEILLVEDSPDDARLVEIGLKTAKVLNNLHKARDGIEAMAFLRREGDFVHAPRPDLILLDLNLPRMDGREVLAEIKKDESLRVIPVVVLTVSRNEGDILKTYNLHANAYIIKPFDQNQFLAVIKTIEDFWLSVVRLPPQQGD